MIKEKVKPMKSHQLHVEHLDAVHNWTEFFAPVELHVKGLTTTATEKVANHSWRIVRREDVSNYVVGGVHAEIEVPEEPNLHL